MVPGDIYIGKATLIQYEINPAFAGDYDGPDDVVVDHTECQERVVCFDDYYMRSRAEFVAKTPWDILKAILDHEAACPSKEKKNDKQSG